MTNDLIGRIQLRYSPDEIQPTDEVIEEMLRTVSDRLRIRLECCQIPYVAESIVVDATIKALRMMGFEGSRSESDADGGSFSVSFIDDVLDAYEKDIAALKRTVHKSGVKFL